jgi:O-antigen ligase
MSSEKANVRIAAAYHVSLSLITLMLAIVPKLVAIGFVVMFVICLIGFFKKQFTLKMNAVLWAYVCFYVLYLVGIYFTNDFPNAMKVLEYKLSFVLIPILFVFRPNFNLKISYPIVGLAVGIVCISIAGFIKAIAAFQLTHNALVSFTSSNICIDHPTYFAAFTMIALGGMWYLYKKDWAGFTILKVLPFLVFGGIMVMLSYSMSAILFLFLVIVFLIIKWIYEKINRYLAIAVVAAAPVFIYFVVANIPALKDEVNNSAKAFSEYVSNPMEYIRGKEEVPTGDKVRLIMWTVTAREYLAHPFGVGTGNVDNHLSSALQDVGQIEMSNKTPNNEIRYNPHNQFLQTTMELGFLGLAVFVFILAKGIQWGVRKKNGLLILVISCLSFNCLFESMLQRQTGIVFFTFWICLLSVSVLNWNKSQSTIKE